MYLSNVCFDASICPYTCKNLLCTLPYVTSYSEATDSLVDVNTRSRRFEMILVSHTLLSSIAYCRSQRCIVRLSHTGCEYPHGCGVSSGKLPVSLSTTRLYLPLTKPKARRRVDHNVFSTPGLIVQLCSTHAGFTPYGLMD